MKVKTLVLFSLLLLNMPAHAGELVSTDWLAQHLYDKNIVIVDMSADSMQYQRFHLPGAVRISYDMLNTKSRTGVSLKINDSQLAMLLGMYGISASDHIIIYDDMAGLQAARLYWQLDSLGHSQKSLLNGGLVKWILEGRKVVAGKVERDKVRYTPNSQKQRHNLATLDDVINNEDAVLLDVRTQEEYVGNPRYPRSGHIPGALFFPWDSNILVNQRFTFKPPATIQAELDRLGLKDKNTPVIIYCQSAHRASHSYFVLRMLGYSRVRVYDGSMAEYSLYRQYPLKMGPSP